MLFGLHVKNFAIIDEAEIEFGEGLNILTGETGAGKSILIGSISAALGGRTSKEIIGKNGEFALVELTFEAPRKEVLNSIEQMGFAPEDGVFIISRKITDTGRSIFRINSETATASQIKEVAMQLMSVHGQSEYMNLLSPAKQLELVDDYDREHIKPARDAVKESFAAHRALKEELDGALTDSGQRERQMDYLRFAISEIESARLTPNEDEELKTEFKRLSNARLIAQTLSETEALIGDDGCSTLMGKATKKMSSLGGIDESIDSIVEAMSEVESLLADLNRDISDYFDKIEDNEARLTEVSDRIDLIDRLKSKYGRTIEEIEERAESFRDELSKYEDYDAYLERLKSNEEKALAKLKTDTEALSALRAASAKKLSALIREAMKDLCFNQSDLEIGLDELEDFTANGRESAQIMVSLNVGEPRLPLSKVASGGELSRIMLAIKSV
ncbi:MAG: AAA family ATPase, partial [Lachnospiraceae bacterium]|nr:AAA family ATPase [Lachnospiraceae bacterium]